MNPFGKIFQISFVCIFCSCVSASLVSKKDAFSYMDEIRFYHARTSALPFDKLKEKIGKSGFFYVVSKEGIVEWHPLNMMNGTDVSNLPMIKEIMQKDYGYGSFDQGGIKRIVMYQTLSDGSKLCFSLDPEEFDEKK